MKSPICGLLLRTACWVVLAFSAPQVRAAAPVQGLDGSPLFDNWRKGVDVHFYKEEEQKMLGEAVAAVVRKALEKNAKAK